MLLAPPDPGLAQRLCFGEAQAELFYPGPRGRLVSVSPELIRKRIAELLAWTEFLEPRDRAFVHCLVAESLKQIGEGEARNHYRAAIDLDPENPEYPWLLGDYLRNYRGPQQPLFPEAEKYFYQALSLVPRDERACELNQIVCYVHRSLVALYERDGLPLARPIDRDRPILFLSSSVVFGKRTADLGEYDDVRDFTSEALFASSRVRLNRDLTLPEQQGIVRAKEQLDVSNRLRIRLGRLPAVDLLYQRRRVTRAHLTSFYTPTLSHEATVDLLSLGVEKPLDAYPLFDLVIRGEIGRVLRRGLIEFQPEGREHGTAFNATAAASRFLGPDKLTFELTAALEDIDQRVENPIQRRVSLLAPSITYELFRGNAFKRRIARRGSEFFVGAALVEEKFGSVDSNRRDFFGGITLRGLPGLESTQSLDITIQPTYLEAHREGIDEDGEKAEELRSAQFRTFVTVLYRLVDWENEPNIRLLPGLVFLNAVFAGAVDSDLEGPDTFLSRSLGAGLDAKIVAPAIRGGTTFLASARFDLQKYPQLRKTESAFVVSLGIGF